MQKISLVHLFHSTIDLVTKVATTIFDHSHSNIFLSTLNP